MTHESADEDEFKFYKNNSVLILYCSNNGLYYHDKTNRQINLLNSVSEKMIGFSETQIKNPNKQGIFMQYFSIPQ